MEPFQSCERSAKSTRTRWKALQVIGTIYENWTWALSTAIDPEDRDFAKAVEVGRKAIELSKTANRWNNLGVALYPNSEYREAATALEKANHTLDGKDRIHRPFLAMSYWQMGEKDKANQFTSLVVVATPNYDPSSAPAVVRIRSAAGGSR